MHKWIAYFVSSGLCTFAHNLTNGEQVSWPNGTQDIVYKQEIFLHSDSWPLGKTLDELKQQL